MISNYDIQRVYLQALNHNTVRVPGPILAELLREIAKARHIRLYDTDPGKEQAKAWTDNDIINFFKGKW